MSNNILDKDLFKKYNFILKNFSYICEDKHCLRINLTGITHNTSEIIYNLYQNNILIEENVNVVVIDNFLKSYYRKEKIKKILSSEC